MIRSTLERLLRRNKSPFPKVPDWTSILDDDRATWDEALSCADGPEVLIAISSGGLAGAAVVESTLAVALTLRGARVHVLLCDSALPACLMTHMGQYRDSAHFVEMGPLEPACSSCYAQGRHVFEPLGLPIHRYSDLITSEEAERVRHEAAAVSLDDVGSYTWDGLEIGEHALAGALRFVTRGDFEGEPHAEGIARRYLHGALVTAHATRRLLRTHAFQHACFHHGIYVPQGIIGEVARQERVHVVNWSAGYRKQCFNFSHEESYHLTLLDEPTELWEDVAWTPGMETEVMDYLESRARGANDWIRFHDQPIENATTIEEQIGLDPSRPSIALLTNILWDAQLHFEHNAFSGMLEWVLETIRYFAARPDLQLIIRAHPGEVRGTLPSRQPVMDEILRVFPELPENVFLIAPDSRISTYTVADHCDAAIIYGTKMGVELSSRGIPVIVAGEAWVRNKGFTLDAGSKAEYFTLLDQLPLRTRMDRDQVQRARQYAYHFFFRRMIPWRFMEATGGYPPFRLAIQGIDELRAGRDPGLDLVCEGILEGAEFLYRAEADHLSEEARMAAS